MGMPEEVDVAAMHARPDSMGVVAQPEPLWDGSDWIVHHNMGDVSHWTSPRQASSDAVVIAPDQVCFGVQL